MSCHLPRHMQSHNVELELGTDAPPRGVPNRGNECYFAACAQLLRLWLMASSGVLASVQQPQAHKDRRQALWAMLSLVSDGDVAPLKTLVRARYSQYRALVQHDAHECLMDCLSALGLDSTTRGTAARGGHGGLLESHVRCGACGAQSKTQSAFGVITLPLPPNCQTFTVLDAVVQLQTDATLCGSDVWACEACARAQRTPASSRQGVRVSRWPAPASGLLVHLARFRPNRTKSNARLVDAASGVPGAGGELLGFICHHGTAAQSGHYVAYVRHGHGAWFKCDDERVERVCGVDDAGRVNALAASAYVLMYGRPPASSLG